jgi:GNAT superfamily N-acetyltransferase
MDGSRTEEEIGIRKIEAADALSAAELSSELGYPVTPEAMEARIRRLAVLEDHVVYAACLSGRVVGWIDVGIVHHLQSQAYGEIGGLIVSNRHRGSGFGRKLVAEAEKWVAGRGVGTILVRSQIAREAAHRFYLRLEYSRIKTSAVFTKALV